MASFGKHFGIDFKKGKAKEDAIKKGTLYRITVLSERLVRLEYSKTGEFNDSLTELVHNRQFEVPNFNIEEDDKYIVISTSYFQLQYLKEKPFKGPSFAPDANLKVKLIGTDKSWYYNHPEARNYPASSFSLENKNNMQKGLYSTDGFVSIEDDSSLKLSDIGILSNSKDDNIDLYLFMYKRDFGLCLKDFFTLTDYPLLLPRYAFGIWWNKDIIYNSEDLFKLSDMFKENEIPLNVILLNEFWHIKDKRNYNLYKSGYSFNPELFKKPEDTITSLHERGIKLGINLDPTEGIRKEEPVYSSFKNELSLTADGNIPFNAFDKMFIIFYFEKIINSLDKIGVDFYWIDYKTDIRSLKALDYYHIRDFLKDESKRPMLMSRNTGLGAHRNGVLYSGETEVSWETLKYLPYFNSSASNLGLSYWSHDVGGFKNGSEDAELYLRYVEFSCFSPIFRFASKRGAYYKREPWRWDYKTYNVAKSYCNLRMQLIPYIYSECYFYHKEGLPFIQPLYYSYPDSVDNLEIRNEYYFGKNLFVCPITIPKAPLMNRVIQKIILPRGVWYDFKTGKKFVGEKKYITFYQDEDYPVFAKAGSIIPQTICDDISSVKNPDVMKIEIFPGDSSSYILYEDDGESSLYKKGNYVLTNINYKYQKDNYTITINPLEGKTNIIPSKREYHLVLRNIKDADVECMLNDKKIDFEKDCIHQNLEIIIKDVDTLGQLICNVKGKDIEISSSVILDEDLNLIINDLNIPTNLKEEIARIAFSKMDVKKKRISIRKLKGRGLNKAYVDMFMKLYDSLNEM